MRIRAYVYLAVLLACVSASPAIAQCDLATGAGCTAGEIYNDEFDKEIAAAGDGLLEAKEKSQVDLPEAESEVSSAPAATTAPSSFAGRIHGSYEDFLKLLAFAVNDVQESDDGKALVVRLNPLRHGRHRLGLTLTVAEPEIGDAVQKAISDAGRSDTVNLLEKELGDFDDLTWAVGYSWYTEICTRAAIVARRCFGRDPRTYRVLLADLIAEPPASPIEEVLELAKKIRAPAGQPDLGVFDRPLDLNPGSRGSNVKDLRALAQSDVQSTLAQVKAMAEAGSDLFWPLIDNQPQIALSWSRRSADQLVGQEYDSLALELQFGGTNINSVFRGCEVDEASCPRARLAEIALAKTQRGAKLTDGKWVLSATYLERKEFRLGSLPLSDLPGTFTPIDQADSSELKVKLQWGALISTQIDGWTPRVDFSAEGLETRDDGLRTQSRWVATATMTLPIAEGVTIPISLNYANKPEFLAESDETFGAHVGLSYRLPFGDAK